jgi:hypothetical protein
MKVELATGYILAKVQEESGLRRESLPEKAKFCFSGLCQATLCEAMLSLLWAEDLDFLRGTLVIGRRGVVHTKFLGAVADGYLVGQIERFNQAGHKTVSVPSLRQPAEELFKGDAVTDEVYRSIDRLRQHDTVTGYFRGPDREQHYLKLVYPVPASLWAGE